MSNDNIYLITDIKGYTPLISSLVSMMNYARYVTLSSISGLSIQQLDYLHDNKSNSIGMLLQHMAMVEKVYQMETFGGISEFSDEQIAALSPGLDLDNSRFEIKDNSTEYYINLLNETRNETLNEFRKRDDHWLKEESSFWYGKKANNWFKWFHVFEDEINHRGQISWLRKRIPSK